MTSRALTGTSLPDPRSVALPLPPARAGALRPATSRVRDSGAACLCLLVVLAAAGCDAERPPDVNAGAISGGNATESITPSPVTRRAAVEDSTVGAQGALEPDEYRLWEGDWYEASSGSVEDNVYFRLDISGADQHGFGYQLEERTVPYGPNAEWSGERTARFDNPLRATDPATGHVFFLSIDPADPYSRIVEVREDGPGAPGWSADHGPDPAGGTFVLDGPTGGAGSRSRRPEEVGVR